MRALALLLLLATPLEAADRRYADAAEVERWAAVGVLRIGGGACTAALIRPNAVLTAAHCVADAEARAVVDADRISFHAGVDRGRQAGAARARRVEIHPGYFTAGRTYDERRIRNDVAVVTLDRPLEGVTPFRVAASPAIGGEVALLSYSQGRQGRLSVQSPCRVTARRTEFLELDCRSDPGASGAPYVSVGAGGGRIIGVNSGSRRRGDARSALALGLDHLQGFIGATGGGAAVGSGGSSWSSQPGATRLPGASTPGTRIGKRAP